MLAIVAADKGAQGGPPGNHKLRGRSAINYEDDIIVLLNEKLKHVAKVNIEFKPRTGAALRDGSSV